jgi:DNA-binding IclR family transcriptional regulator
VTRPAPAAWRAVQILELLTTHAVDSFSLSEIARRLSLNVASTHTVLAVLEEAGYVVRHPTRKTYGLGPSLVAAGDAALRRYPAIDAARDEIRRLSAELDRELLITAVAGTRIVALARAGKRHPLGLEVGGSVPYAPPLGSVFAAWQPPEEITAWLARAEPGADAATRARYQASAQAVRRRGYFVAVDEARLEALDTAAPGRDARAKEAAELVAELAELGYHRQVAPTRTMVAAPVFDVDGRAVLAIVLLGLDDTLSGLELLAAATRIRDAGLVVTRRARGRVPDA